MSKTAWVYSIYRISTFVDYPFLFICHKVYSIYMPAFRYAPAYITSAFGRHTNFALLICATLLTSRNRISTFVDKYSVMKRLNVYYVYTAFSPAVNIKIVTAA